MACLGSFIASPKVNVHDDDHQNTHHGNGEGCPNAGLDSEKSATLNILEMSRHKPELTV